jgi:hypothetical protein
MLPEQLRDHVTEDDELVGIKRNSKARVFLPVLTYLAQDV